MAWLDPHRRGPIIAVSGLLLIAFVVLHLVGVGLAPLAPDRFEAYATALHQRWWLPLAEGVLLAVALVHVGLTLVAQHQNRRAGNQAALVSRRGDPLAAFAARSQPWAGLVLLAFLGLHLAQLRWVRPADGAELAAVGQALAAPGVPLLYLAAAGALGLHVLHGSEAAHRRLGLLDPSNAEAIRRGGRGLALLLAAGFAVVTLLLAVAPTPALP
jgi:succinate dehydrogenase / fumarate reductase, cytochrome b subunit